jgi:hypothetical protein
MSTEPFELTEDELLEDQVDELIYEQYEWSESHDCEDDDCAEYPNYAGQIIALIREHDKEAK